MGLLERKADCTRRRNDIKTESHGGSETRDVVSHGRPDQEAHLPGGVSWAALAWTRECGSGLVLCGQSGSRARRPPECPSCGPGQSAQGRLPGTERAQTKAQGPCSVARRPSSADVSCALPCCASGRRRGHCPGLACELLTLSETWELQLSWAPSAPPGHGPARLSPAHPSAPGQPAAPLPADPHSLACPLACGLARLPFSWRIRARPGRSGWHARLPIPPHTWDGAVNACPRSGCS